MSAARTDNVFHTAQFQQLPPDSTHVVSREGFFFRGISLFWLWNSSSALKLTQQRLSGLFRWPMLTVGKTSLKKRKKEGGVDGCALTPSLSLSVCEYLGPRLLVFAGIISTDLCFT